VKASNKTVATKIVQYVCIGLITIINYFLLWFLFSIFFGDTITTYIVTGIVLAAFMALTFTTVIDKVLVFFKHAKKYEHLEEHEKPLATLDQDYEAFLQVVNTTSKEMGIPTPQVYIMTNDFPNISFLNPRVLVVTPTFLSSFSTDQQKAALLHEIYHVKNGDVQLLALADMANTFGTIVTWVFTFVLGILGVSSAVNAVFDKESRQNNIAILLVAWILKGILSLLNWMLRMFTLGISRSSEYLADEFVATAGYKDALIEYLQKMSAINPKLYSGYPVEMWKKHPATKKRIEHLNVLNAA